MFPNITPKDPTECIKILRDFDMWQVEEIDASDLPKSPPDYWLGNLKSGALPHLTKFFVALLPILHCTAEVERLFSQVNATKTKLRNKLSGTTRDRSAEKERWTNY